MARLTGTEQTLEYRPYGTRRYRGRFVALVGTARVIGTTPEPATLDAAATFSVQYEMTDALTRVRAWTKRGLLKKAHQATCAIYRHSEAYEGAQRCDGNCDF